MTQKIHDHVAFQVRNALKIHAQVASRGQSGEARAVPYNRPKIDPSWRLKQGGCRQTQARADTSGLVLHCLKFLGF